MNTKLTLLIAGLFTAFLPELRHASAQVTTPTPIPEYTVIDLGTLGGDFSVSTGIIVPSP